MKPTVWSALVHLFTTGREQENRELVRHFMYETAATLS